MGSNGTGGKAQFLQLVLFPLGKWTWGPRLSTKDQKNSFSGITDTFWTLSLDMLKFLTPAKEYVFGQRRPHTPRPGRNKQLPSVSVFCSPQASTSSVKVPDHAPYFILCQRQFICSFPNSHKTSLYLRWSDLIKIKSWKSSHTVLAIQQCSLFFLANLLENHTEALLNPRTEDSTIWSSEHSFLTS